MNAHDVEKNAALDRQVAAQRAAYTQLRARRVRPWIQQRLAEINRDIQRDQHAARLLAIRTEAAATRRRQEAEERDDKRAALAIYTDTRRRYPTIVTVTPIDLRAWRQRQVAEEVALDRPLPAAVRRDLEALVGVCHHEGITVVFAGTGNGYAWPPQRAVEVPTIRSMFAVATFAHEIGHVLTPSMKDRVPRELLAWEWARAHLLTWDADCHECQRSGLLTYRRSANATEQLEIDRLISRRGFREERLRRAVGSEINPGGGLHR